ncbi:unnamed protein product, partial [marine sediment metagenome]
MNDRHIDRDVARFVWPDIETFLDDGNTYVRPSGSGPVPHYSTDIAAAWELMGQSCMKDYLVGRDFCLRENTEVDGWACAAYSYEWEITYDDICDTAPRAICLAFMNAKEKKK